jgi:trehalose 6-phosphate phosphatase
MSSVDTIISRAWQVLQSAPSALITDVDGTISRIAPRPEDAVVSQSVRRSLSRIAPHLALTAVITAREATVARAMVGVDELEYVGNYALDDDTALGISPGELTAAREQVEAQLGALPCVLVEDKGISFALHYRACDDHRGARSALLTIAAPIAAQAGAKLVEGKQVLEMVPAGLPDKGTAVRHLLDQNRIDGVVYFGDDLSDIAVFRELARLRESEGYNTLSVAVIDVETDEQVREGADETVSGVTEVEAVLEALAGKLSGGSD